jgi:DNA-binding MarR family transcriptional regulator
MSKPIGESVGFALAQACKSHRYAIDSVLQAHHLRVGQEMILLQLWAGEGISQSQLVERICVEPPTMTKMLQRMEAEGLITRRPNPDDARVSLVYLGDLGRQIEQQVAESWERVESQAMAGMTAEERMLLRRLLMQVRENLSRPHPSS